MVVSSSNKRFHDILALIGIDVTGATKIVITSEMNEPVRVDITRFTCINMEPIVQEQAFHLLPIADDSQTESDGINKETKSGK